MAKRESLQSFLVVRVKPRARRSGLLGRHGTGVKVGVRAAPERGKANEELLQVLGAALGVGPEALEIVAGGGSQDKRVRVEGLDPDELRRRLDAAAGSIGDV
jgi:hypothetical protein